MSDSKLLTAAYLYEFSVFRLDPANGLFVNEELVSLAPKVLQTLTLLVENRGRVISKDEFFEKIWADTFVEDNALSFNISQLRKTLARFDDQTNFVETIPKRGFRFVAEVREVGLREIETEIFLNRRSVSKVVLEELPETVPAKLLSEGPVRSKIFNLKTLALAAAVLLVVLSLAFVHQFRQNRALRSFDAIRTVKLTSWASHGSSTYSNYSSSHDGELIAYSSLRNGVSEHIFVKQFNGGEEIRLTNDEWRNFNPIWSPDDKQIAFVSQRETQAGIYTCPFLGGAPTLIKVIGAGTLFISHWSKDGSTLFYEFNGNLFRLDIASKEVAQLTDFTTDIIDFRYFAVSPGEDQIVFCDGPYEATDIWMMTLGGGERIRLTNNAEREVRPFWHPDGKRIFYTVRRDNQFQINVVFINEGEPVQIKRGDSEYKMTGISDDGRKVFYSNYEDKSDIWGAKTDTGEEFPVAAGGESEFWLDASPDDRFLAFQTNSLPYVPAYFRRSLVQVRAVDEKRILHSFRGHNPKWLPGSRQIAFLRRLDDDPEFNLWLFDTVTGAETQLTTEGVPRGGYALLPYDRTQVADFGWSSDGSKYVYLDKTNRNIWLGFSGGGKTVNLTNSDNSNVIYYGPVWSPAGDRLAFVSSQRPASDGEKAVWSVWLSEQDNPREIFKTPETLRLLGWSPDGDRLFFEMDPVGVKASPSNVKILEVLMNGNARIINSFEKISALSMTLSADGKNVAFAARREGSDNIYISPIATGEIKKITANTNHNFCFGSLKWAPDGKTIYYDRQEQIYTISMFDNFS
jgi:Tol biopolymer transport system component/DNA-binding winged helix-turn-helix (wHTH) protein